MSLERHDCGGNVGNVGASSARGIPTTSSHLLNRMKMLYLHEDGRAAVG